MLAVNLRAPLMLARLLAEPMAARGSGHLVFVSSLQGKSASPLSALYTATKFGLRGLLALAAARPVRPRGRRLLRVAGIRRRGRHVRRLRCAAAAGGAPGAGPRRSPPRSSARSSATARRSTRRRSSCAPARGSPESRRGSPRQSASASAPRSPARSSRAAPIAASVPAGMAVQTRPRGVALLVASPGRALASRCSRALRSRCSPTSTAGSARPPAAPTIAAAINNLVAFVATFAVVLATRALPRARARLRALGRRACLVLPRRPRRGGTRAGVGRRGAGGRRRAADGRARVRLDGRQPARRCRRAGSCGTAADHAAARRRRAARRPRDRGQRARRDGDRTCCCSALALAAGLGMSLQAAANGQLARATGEPWAASLVNVAVGLAMLGRRRAGHARDVVARRHAGQPAALRRRTARRVRGRRQRHRRAARWASSGSASRWWRGRPRARWSST